MRFNALGAAVVGLRRSWLDDATWLEQVGDNRGWNVCDQHGNIVMPGGATVIAAGGGKIAVSAPSTARTDCRTNFGYASEVGYIIDIGRDGTVAEIPNYQAGGAVRLLNGPTLNGAVQHARVVGPDHLLVTFYGRRVVSTKLGDAKLPAGIEPFAATLIDERWLLYHTHRWLVLQEFGRARGKVLAGAPAYSPDGIKLGDALKIGYCLNVGETPDSYREVIVLPAALIDDLSTLSDSAPAPVPTPPPAPVPAPPAPAPALEVPNRAGEVAQYLRPRLLRFADEEQTRTHSFELVNALCHELRSTDPRWGLLEKTGGARVRDRAADVLLYDLGNATAQVVDVVANAEGHADQGNPEGKVSPSWGVKDIRPISQWKKPYPIGGDMPPTNSPATVVSQETINGLIKAALAPVLDELKALRAKVAELEARTHAEPPKLPKHVGLKSAHGLYMAAEPNGRVIADRGARGSWETFTIESAD